MELKLNQHRRKFNYLIALSGGRETNLNCPQTVILAASDLTKMTNYSVVVLYLGVNIINKHGLQQKLIFRKRTDKNHSKPNVARGFKQLIFLLILSHYTVQTAICFKPEEIKNAIYLKGRQT